MTELRNYFKKLYNEGRNKTMILNNLLTLAFTNSFRQMSISELGDYMDRRCCSIPWENGKNGLDFLSIWNNILVVKEVDSIPSLWNYLGMVQTIEEVNILDEIWNFITNWEVLGVRYNRESTPVDAMLEELSEKFAAIASSLREKGQGVFVFIDEADKAPAKAELGEFIKVLTERLAKRGSDNVGIGVVGISSVIKKLKESHESAVRILNPIELTTLLPEERKEVVQKGLGEAEEKNGITTSITDRALNFISDLSEGYPYFIQQYAYSAFEEDTDNNIDVRDVAVGLTKENGALQQLGIRHFENMYTEEVRSDDYRTVFPATIYSAQSVFAGVYWHYNYGVPAGGGGGLSGENRLKKL